MTEGSGLVEPTVIRGCNWGGAYRAVEVLMANDPCKTGSRLIHLRPEPVLAQEEWEVVRFPAIAEEDEVHEIETILGLRSFTAAAGRRNGTPAEIRRMIEDLGLRTITFQPFRDFEGMPEPQRAKVFARAERKFDVMQELGCDLLLVCSNVSPDPLGAIDRAAADFRELGERTVAVAVEQIMRTPAERCGHGADWVIEKAANVINKRQRESRRCGPPILRLLRTAEKPIRGIVRS